MEVFIMKELWFVTREVIFGANGEITSKWGVIGMIQKPGQAVLHLPRNSYALALNEYEADEFVRYFFVVFFPERGWC